MAAEVLNRGVCKGGIKSKMPKCVLVKVQEM